MDERRACRLTGLARSTQRRRQKEKADDDDKQRLQELARERQRFGYRRLTALLRREGRNINHKRVYRMYRELGLAMRRRKRRHSGQRLAAATNTPLERANQRWAMDFVSDTLAHGRTFRVLTIIDEYTRECLRIEADTSLPGMRVIRVLEQLAETRGLPEEIHVDHGPEFVCRSVRSWCEKHRVLLRYIDAGRPMQNGHIESFNGRFRDECLNANWFPSLAHARSQVEAWRTDYNQSRPHSALGYSTPNEFAALIAQRQPQPIMMGNLL
jgi:putative transposase